jgi:hypothetical protein
MKDGVARRMITPWEAKASALGKVIFLLRTVEKVSVDFQGKGMPKPHRDIMTRANYA